MSNPGLSAGTPGPRRLTPGELAAGDLDAGRQALARGDWEEARARFEAALQAGESPEALEGHGWACWWLEQTAASFESREKAYALFRQDGDSRSAARVAIGLAVAYADLRGDFAVASGWLERARRLLAPLAATPEHGWLALWEGHLVRLESRNLAAARRLAGKAVETGRDLRVTDLEMLGLALEGLLLVDEGRVSDGMRRLDEATAAAMAGEMSDLDAINQACCFLIHACERVRDYDRAAQWCARAEEFCRRWRLRPLFSVCRTYYASVLMWRGAWSDAERELIEAGGLAAGSRPAMVVAAAVRLAELRRRQGRWDEAEEIFERFESHPLSLLGRAALALDRGEPETASDLLERFLRRTPADDRMDRAAALELLVRARIALGDPGRAAALLEELRQVASDLDVEPMRATLLLAEGAVAAAAGSLDGARRCFEDAADLLERNAAPFEAARARAGLARCLAALGRTVQAEREARRAARRFQEIGALREAERASALTATAAPRSRPELTRREVDVLRLVAEGLADKEIAGRLSLSEHTVHRHVSNILAKLALSSRAAAVAHAARQGIL